MKIKAVCGAIISAAAVGGGASVLAQDVSDTGVVSQSYVTTIHGANAEAWISAFIEKLRKLTNSEDANTRAMASQAISSLQGKHQSFSVQIKSPSPLSPAAIAAPLTAPTLTFPTGVSPGATVTSTNCSMSNNLWFVDTTTWEYMPSNAASTDGWVIIKDDHDRVTSCPAT